MVTFTATHNSLQGEWHTEIVLGGPTIPTQYEGAWSNPPSGVVYCVLRIQPLPGRAATTLDGTGSGKPLAEGLQLAELFAPADVGYSAIYTAADAICAVYDGKRITGVADVDRIVFRQGDVIPVARLSPTTGLLSVNVSHSYFTTQTA